MKHRVTLTDEDLAILEKGIDSIPKNEVNLHTENTLCILKNRFGILRIRSEVYGKFAPTPP